MEIETLGLFILTETLLSLTPGPAVLLVLGLSVRHGFKIGVAASLGIISTNAVYFTLSALGVGALIVASSTLFTLIKFVGALYLAYLGINMLLPMFKRMCGQVHHDKQIIDIDKASKNVQTLTGSFKKSFIQGFTLQASNPKNILFFVAILPQFISPEGNIVLQLIILGIASVLLELPILLFYGFAFAKTAKFMKEIIVERIEAIAGCFLIFMGGALALYRKSS